MSSSSPKASFNEETAPSDNFQLPQALSSRPSHLSLLPSTPSNRQGELGDFFYIVENGSFKFIINDIEVSYSDLPINSRNRGY